MKLFKFNSVVWDLDDNGGDNTEAADALGLPSAGYVYAEDADDIADILSDEFGWCIKSLDTEEISESMIVCTTN